MCSKSVTKLHAPKVDRFLKMQHDDRQLHFWQIAEVDNHGDVCLKPSAVTLLKEMDRKF